MNASNPVTHHHNTCHIHSDMQWHKIRTHVTFTQCHARSHYVTTPQCSLYLLTLLAVTRKLLFRIGLSCWNFFSLSAETAHIVQTLGRGITQSACQCTQREVTYFTDAPKTVVDDIARVFYIAWPNNDHLRVIDSGSHAKMGEKYETKELRRLPLNAVAFTKWPHMTSTIMRYKIQSIMWV